MQFNQFRKSELGISSTQNAIRPASAVYQSQPQQIPEQDEYNSTQDIEQIDYYNQLDQQNIYINANLNSLQRPSSNFNDNLKQRNTYISNINNNGEIVMKQIEGITNMNQGDNQQEFIYDDKEESDVFNENQNILIQGNQLITNGNIQQNQRLLMQQQQQYFVGDTNNMDFTFPQQYQHKNEYEMYNNHNIQYQNQGQQYNERGQQQNSGLKQSSKVQRQQQSQLTNQDQNVYLNGNSENQMNNSHKIQNKMESTIVGQRPQSGGYNSTNSHLLIYQQYPEQYNSEQLQQQLLQNQQLQQKLKQQLQQTIQKQLQVEQLEQQENQQQQQYTQTMNDQLSLPELIDDVLIDLKVGLVQNAMKKFENIIQKAFLELGDEAFWKLFIKIVKKLNFISIDYLNQGDINSSLKILNKCDLWTQPSDFGYFPDMRALTLNHIGCTYRRQNDYKKAIFFCEQSLKILLNANQRSYLGITYLNLSALSSQIGQHKKGLEYARMALVESQHEFMQLVKNSNSYKKFQQQLQNQKSDIQDSNNNNNNINENQSINNNGIDDEEDLDYQNKINTLIISYHNIAAEEEYFQNYEEALIHYENSVNTAEEYLGPNSKITKHFKQEFEKFSQRYSNYKVYCNTGIQNGIFNKYQTQLLSNTDQFFVVQLPNGMYQISDIKKKRASSASGKRKLRKKSKKNKKKMIVISNISQPYGYKNSGILSLNPKPVYQGEQVQQQNQIQPETEGYPKRLSPAKNYLLNEEENYSSNYNSQQFQAYPFVPSRTMTINSSGKNLYAIDNNSVSLANTTQINQGQNMSMAATTSSEMNQQLNANTNKQQMRPQSAVTDSRYKNLSYAIKTITNSQVNYQTQDQGIISPTQQINSPQKQQIHNSPQDPKDNLRIKIRSNQLFDLRNNQLSDQKTHEFQQKLVHPPQQQKNKLQLQVKKQLSPQQKQQMKSFKKKRLKNVRNISLKLSNNVDYSIPFTNFKSPFYHKNSLPLFSPQSSQITSFQMSSPFPSTTTNKAHQYQNNQQKQYLFYKPQSTDQNTSSQRKQITFALNQQQSQQESTEQQQNEQQLFKANSQNNNQGILENKINQQYQNQGENLTRIQLLQNIKQQYTQVKNNMENIENKIQKEIKKVNNRTNNEQEIVPLEMLNQINPQDLQQIENFSNNQSGNQHMSLNSINLSNKPSFHYNYANTPSIGSGHRKTPSYGQYAQQNQIFPSQSLSKKFSSDKFLIRNTKISQIAAGTQAKKENIQNKNQNNQSSQLTSTQNISKLSQATNLNLQNQQNNMMPQNVGDIRSISASGSNMLAYNQQIQQQQQFYMNNQGQRNYNIQNTQQQPNIQQQMINNTQNQNNSNSYQYNTNQDSHQNQQNLNRNQNNPNYNQYNNQNPNQNQNHYNNEQINNNQNMYNQGSQKQVFPQSQSQSGQIIEILLENNRTMIKELRDPKEKPFEGALKFILNRQTFSLTAVFESDRLSSGQIEHFINVSDIFNAREQEYSQIRQLLVTFCNEITKYIYVNSLQQCLSITFQHSLALKNQNQKNQNQLNNKNENIQTSNYQTTNDAILFDKIPIKLNLKSIQREIDVVVKNCSESILLLCDVQINAILHQHDHTQSPRSTEDDNIRPLVNAYFYPASHEQGEHGRTDLSYDSIQPIILDPSLLNDPNNYNDLYKEYQIQNNNQNIKNEGNRNKNKHGNKQHTYGGEEMILEVEEADTFSQMKNNTLNHPSSNRNSSTLLSGNQKKQFESAPGSVNNNFNNNMNNMNNNNNDNNEEEILDEVQDYDDDFDDDFQEAIDEYEKNKNEPISRPKSSYQKRGESSKPQKNSEQINYQIKSTGESKYGFQNNEFYKKKQQNNDKRLSQIENEFSMSKEDDNFNDKKSDNFEFDMYDKDPTFSGVKHQGRFDDSENQSFEQITDMVDGKQSSKRQSIQKQSQFSISKMQAEKQQTGHANQVSTNGDKQNNLHQKSPSHSQNQENNNTKKNTQGKDSKNFQSNEEIIQDRLLRQTGNRRNTPPPKIVINNGFDNDDPYIAYDNVQVKNQKQKDDQRTIEDEEAKEEFQKLLQERDPQQLNNAATFIQKKYKNKKTNQSEVFKEDSKTKVPQQKNIETKIEEPPIDINDDNRDDFEKAATLIGQKYKMRKQKQEMDKQSKPVQEKKEEIKQEKKEQPKEEVVLEGPIEEYEKIANLIGVAYRKKKQREQEKQTPIQKEVPIQKEAPIQKEKIQKKEEEPPIVLEGPVEEYEKIANLIGGAYRKKKQREQEKQVTLKNEQIQEQKAVQPENPKKVEEPVVLEGPVEEYVDVANKIGAAYKLKKERMRKKQEEEEQQRQQQQNQ